MVAAAAARVRARASRHPRRGPADAVDRGAREAADRVRRRRHSRHLPARQHLDPRVRGARRARAARRLRLQASSVDPRDYFAGIWDTNVAGRAVRRAVVRRHAAALLPPRPARARRLRRPARDVGGVDARARRRQGPRRTGPLRDPAAAQRGRAAARAGAAAGRPLLRDDGRYGNFRSPASAARSRSTSTCSGSGWAPPVTDTQISNVWNEFGRGTFAFYITGPWNIGEFKRRLPADRAGRLDDGAAARARRAGRVDRRRLEPGRLSRARAHKAAAWKLIEYLSRPDVAAALPRADRRPAAAAQRVARPGARRRRPCARVPRPARARQAGAQGAGVGAHRRTRCGSWPSARCARPADGRRGRARARRARRPHPREAALDARATGRRAMRAPRAALVRSSRRRSLVIGVFFFAAGARRASR